MEREDLEGSRECSEALALAVTWDQGGGCPGHCSAPKSFPRRSSPKGSTYTRCTCHLLASKYEGREHQLLSISGFLIWSWALWAGATLALVNTTEVAILEHTAHSRQGYCSCLYPQQRLISSRTLFFLKSPP